ncbi:translation initiation factor eIF3 subunit [Parathielavia hyrcaniae]|uniref:Eukaryotic translation initiation factor 3 subunit J n=1 Tax=Parathielavia hyrcaniae TaxID=113614 RepID=A0AAN6PZM3_9PEZI|nr:translation initiation factor eIF3 subunit [Parathielavia hyrcaniae]
MPGPSKQWEEEEDSSDSNVNSPVVGATRRKFDDEEAEDSDVLESWDAAEDSDVEREKAKKAAEAKAKAEAEAAANKKSKAQRIAERQAERAKAKLEGDEDDSDDETEAQKRERLRRTEKEADLKHAEDLFAGVGANLGGRKATLAGSAVPVDASDPTKTVDLSDLPLFNPANKAQFENLRNVMGPILSNSAKKPHYTAFLQDFVKQLAKDLPSDQIKKVTSSLTALGNEKMKEEKAADKGGKKSKAAKTKASLAGVARGGGVADGLQTYDDDAGFGDDDFM